MAAATRYQLHSLTIALTGEATPLRARLESRLRLVPRTDARTADVTFDVGITESPRASLPTPQGTPRSIYEHPAGTYSYFPDSDELLLDHAGIAVAHARPAAGHATIRATAKPEAVEVAAHLMFTLPLVETLKRHALFGVHAAAVAAGQRCLLLAGPSGAGKSTLALVCARAGMALLSDDLVFLERRDAALRVHGFPDEIGLARGTAWLIPELARYRTDHDYSAGKRAVPPDEVSPHRVADASPPAALVFTAVTRAPASRLVPMTADAAFEALAPNVLPTDRAASQEHLDALALLATSCPSYRMEVGIDVDAQASLLMRTLAI